jgi:hypothetical protein
LLLGCLCLNPVRAVVHNRADNLVHPVLEAVPGNLVLEAALASPVLEAVPGNLVHPEPVPVRRTLRDPLALQVAWGAVLEAENTKENTRAAVARAEAALAAQHQPAPSSNFITANAASKGGVCRFITVSIRAADNPFFYNRPVLTLNRLEEALFSLTTALI